MTPKEKAKDLVDRMRVWQFSSTKIDFPATSKEYAIKCALIAVDEIISNQYDYTPKAFDDYWQEVRNEIKKL